MNKLIIPILYILLVVCNIHAQCNQCISTSEDGVAESHRKWKEYKMYKFKLDLASPCECDGVGYCFEYEWMRKEELKSLKLKAFDLGITLSDKECMDYLNHKCSSCAKIDPSRYREMKEARSSYGKSSRSSGSGRSSNAGMSAYRTYRRTGGYKGYKGGW